MYVPQFGRGQAIRIPAARFSGPSQGQTAGPATRRGPATATAARVDRGRQATAQQQQPEDQVLDPIRRDRISKRAAAAAGVRRFPSRPPTIRHSRGHVRQRRRLSTAKAHVEKSVFSIIFRWIIHANSLLPSLYGTVNVYGYFSPRPFSHDTSQKQNVQLYHCGSICTTYR